MSTLSNPSDEITTEDQTKQLLLEMVLEPTKAVSQQALRQSDVDIDMLEKTYEEGIRPYLDYLHGYRALLDQDPLKATRDKTERWSRAHLKHWIIVPEPWEHVLSRSGVHPTDVKTVQVVNLQLYSFKGARSHDPYRRLTIFLTRRGKWVVRTESCLQRSTHGEPTHEVVRQFPNIRDMWAWMKTWGIEDYSISFHESDYGRYGRQPATVPLFIEGQLRRILESTIDIRRGRLRSLEGALEAASKRFSRVDTLS